MKKLTTIFLLFITCTSIHAQSCIEVPRFFTAGFHYLTNKQASGFQFEIGSTGSESNISYYAIFTAYRPKPMVEAFAVTNYPDLAFGGKIAYRFIRVTNVLNVYATTAAGIDMVKGFYNSNSIKLLTIIGGKVALSIEPSYLPVQKAFVAQAGVNIILD